MHTCEVASLNQMPLVVGMFDVNGNRNPMLKTVKKHKSAAKRPETTIKFVKTENTQKVIAVLVPELGPLPEEGKKEERPILVSEMLTPGQHNNVPKQTVETKDTKDEPKTKTESVRRLSSQMELGGRQNKEPSHFVNEDETIRGDYVVSDMVVVVGVLL